MGPASILILSIILVILIVLSYFFSGAETAFTAANIAKLNKLNTIESGFRASSVIRLKNKKEQLIGTVLIGNNILNILSSSIGTMIAFELFGATGVIFSSLVISFIIIVFAEVLPKTYAINNPEKMALFSTPLMDYCIKILYPITKLVAFIVNIILKAVGKDSIKEATPVFEALRNLVLMQQKSDMGEDSKASLEVINSILDLTEIHVSQIMTHRKDIVSINIDLPQKDILNQAISTSYSYIPLWKDDEYNIIAILNMNEVFNLLKTCSIEEILLDNVIEKPIFTLDKTPISTQLHNFKKAKTNFSVIQDEYGELKGIVTLSDIIEEILGEVYLRDKNKGNIIYVSDNLYSISGKTHIKDINRELKWNLPYKNASTLAGIIMYALGRIPQKDEHFSFYGYNFRIVSVNETSILKIIVGKAANES